MVAAIGSICICEIIDDFDGDDDSDDFFHFDWQGFWVMAYGVWGMVGGKLISGQVGSGVIKSTCGRQLYQPANGKRAAIDQLRNAATASLYIGIHMVSTWYLYGIYMVCIWYLYGIIRFSVWFCFISLAADCRIKCSSNHFRKQSRIYKGKHCIVAGQLNACLSPNGLVAFTFTFHKKPRPQKPNCPTLIWISNRPTNGFMCASIITIIIQIRLRLIRFRNRVAFRFYTSALLFQIHISSERVWVWVFAFWVHCQNWKANRFSVSLSVKFMMHNICFICHCLWS